MSMFTRKIAWIILQCDLIYRLLTVAPMYEPAPRVSLSWLAIPAIYYLSCNLKRGPGSSKVRGDRMPCRQAVAVSVLSASLLFQVGCSAPVGSSQPGNPRVVGTQPSAGAGTSRADARVSGETAKAHGRHYPLHTRIVATTFWVGEIFDPHSPDGSQVISTYDAHWMKHYGGCDGVVTRGRCETQRRVAANGFFPTRMTPRENPFYLDLPFDDVNNAAAFSQRARLVPWANDPGYAGHAHDPAFSYMKNRWVKLMRDGRTCYGQIEDAGPGDYNDHRYVFGADNHRPASRLYNRAGLDVSPALTGCLVFSELNGDDDRVNWQFVDAVDVPHGPWTRLVTTQAVSE